MDLQERTYVTTYFSWELRERYFLQIYMTLSSDDLRYNQISGVLKEYIYAYRNKEYHITIYAKSKKNLQQIDKFISFKYYRPFKVTDEKPLVIKDRGVWKSRTGAVLPYGGSYTKKTDNYDDDEPTPNKIYW